MILRLPYGNEREMVDLRGMRVHALRPSAPSKRVDVAALAAAAVDNPVAGESLGTLCRGRRRAVVVVPDTTRKAGLTEILPVLIKRIREASPEVELTLLVACGTHPPPSPAALEGLLGPAAAGEKVVCHDSREHAALVDVGVLASGQSLRLHRLVCETEVLITVGAIRHHYFAGFGGGPKMIFPGCAGYEEIQVNHSRVLVERSGAMQRHPACEPGVLEGNPVAEEIADAAGLCPPQMALCLVPDADGRMAWAAAGPWRQAFDAAVAKTREWFEVPAQRFPFVVATGGGHPSDSSLIQAHKGLDAAVRFLEPGGELLYLASIEHGLGSDDMQVFVDQPDPISILQALKRRWIQYGHTTLRIVEKTDSAKVHLLSNLESVVAARLGFKTVTSADEVADRWREHSPGTPVGVITGPAVYPRT